MARTATNTAAPQLTNLNSLANGAAKSIGLIAFNTNGAHLATVEIKTTLGSTGVSATGTIDYYFIGSQINTSDWTDNIDPTSVSDISASIKNAIKIDSSVANANSQVVLSVLDIFAAVGAGYGYGAILVKNNTGAAFAATGNDANYQTIVFS